MKQYILRKGVKEVKGRIYLGVIVLFAMLITNGPISWAEEEVELAEEVIEFGNTMCPISNEEIKEDEVVKYEYAGVIYNFCCKMCLKDFKKDPQKYIERLEAQKEAEEEKEEASEEHGREHEHEHEHHHH